MLVVGDRVGCHGLALKSEPDRHGTIAELYRGKPSAVAKGLEMAAVRWDDTGEVEHGYIVSSGRLFKLTAETAPTQTRI